MVLRTVLWVVAVVGVTLVLSLALAQVWANKMRSILTAAPPHLPPDEGRATHGSRASW